MNAITVTELSNYIKSLLDCDEKLSSILVSGELSNYKIHSSGHHYFSLKDDSAVISAVMFRGNASKIKFTPQNGMKVVLLGNVSSFPKNGQYQIYVNDMQPEGIGALFAAFEELKLRLYKEGIFSKSFKKSLPKYPEKIALITSPTGAAVRDMLRILKSRFPLSEVIVCPVKVQGEDAAKEIAEMIHYVDRYSLADIIITGRGGGSIEDLWAFNEEIVARAIFNCIIPVISAVGHEPDITISDYVADIRASTPSNAAEIAVCDSAELKASLSAAFTRLIHSQKSIFNRWRQKLLLLSGKKVLSSPQQYTIDRRMYLSILEQRLEKSTHNILNVKKHKFVRAAATLDALSPLKVISRGYSMVTENGRVVKSVSTVKRGMPLNITVSDGTIDCTVTDVKEN